MCVDVRSKPVIWSYYFSIFKTILQAISKKSRTEIKKTNLSQQNILVIFRIKNENKCYWYMGTYIWSYNFLYFKKSIGRILKNYEPYAIREHWWMYEIFQRPWSSVLRWGITFVTYPHNLLETYGRVPVKSRVRVKVTTWFSYFLAKSYRENMRCKGELGE